MKKILSFAAFAALCFAFAACQTVQPEDVFSTDPVAPELQAHGDILLTEGTTGEDLTFVWKAYRNLPEGLNYEFFMEYDNAPVPLSTGKETFYKTDKAAFRSLVLSSYDGLPQNDTFSLTFYVRVANNGEIYQSNSLTLNVFAFGDGVAPEVTLVSGRIELDPADPMAQVELLSWTPARLVYGEEVTYNVYMSVCDGEPVLMAEGLSETSYGIGVDALNEAIIAAGGAENADVAVRFIVAAVCDSMPGGVDTASRVMIVKTYLSTFPEVLYIPGSHQGWDPASAPTIALSTKTKGYYEGIVDLTTQDGSDVEFKFSPVPKWEGDFGGVVTVNTKEGVYSSAIGTVGVADNIKVPSGKYVIMLNKKLNKISMVTIKSVGIIGEAVGGWSDEIPMTWNEETNVFTVEVENLVPGPYKFRLNNDWDYSIGENLGVNDGDNLNNTAEGKYRITLDMSRHPYTVKFTNLSYPAQVYLPGSHNDWGWTTILAGNGEGVYEGFANVGGEWGFKVTPSGDWKHEQWGLESEGGTSDNGEITYNIADGGGNIRQGTDVTYARVIVDLVAQTVKVFPITSVEVVGSFTDWGTNDQYLMTYDAAANVWKLEGALIPAGGEWKFRMNSGWAVNVGGDLADLVQDGGNIKGIEAGIYTVELSLATKPYKATLTKTGDVDAPKWGNRLVVAGDYSGHNWSGSGDPKLMGNYTGYFQGPLTMYNMTYGFKFVHDGNWTGMNGGEALNWMLAIGGGDNMTLPNGTYWFKVDMEAATATAFAVTKVGLIGDFNGWSDDVVMAFDETALTYSGVITTTADGQAFKVRFNGNWDYSLGGDINELTSLDGGNIAIEKAGTYKIVLDMAHATPNLTITAQ